VPFDAHSFQLRSDDVKDQMIDIDGRLGIARCVENESVTGIPPQVFSQGFLHDANHRHRSLRRPRLRVVRPAEIYRPLHVQHAFLLVIVLPPQTIQLLLPQSRKRGNNECCARDMVVDLVVQRFDFAQSVTVRVGIIAGNDSSLAHRIEIGCTFSDRSAEDTAQNNSDIPVSSGCANVLPVSLQQPAEDFIDVRSTNLADLNVGNQVFDDFVVAPVTLKGEKRNGPEVRAPACGEVSFDVRLQRIRRLSLSLSEVDLGGDTISFSPDAGRRSAVRFRAMFRHEAEFMVGIFVLRIAVDGYLFPHFQNPIPTVDSD